MKSILEFLIKQHIKKELAKYAPKDSKELRAIIEQRIKDEGPNCNLNDIDISALDNLDHVFTYLDFNGDISKWNTSNITSMYCTFEFCKFTGENGDISDWDVSKVENMHSLFCYGYYNGDISKWNTKKVTTMADMFQHSKWDGTNGDISDWDVSNVSNFMQMFEATDYDGDLSKWKMDSAGLLSQMFKGSKFTGHNGDISKWKFTNHIYSFEEMFSHSKLDISLENWNISSVVKYCNMRDMFKATKWARGNNKPSWYK